MTAIEQWSSQFGSQYDARFAAFSACPYNMRIASLLKSAHVRTFADTNSLDVPDQIFERDGVDIREMQKIALSQIDYNTVIPPMPSVIEKIDSVLSTPDVSFKEVAEVVALDAALATKVLQLINSSMYAVKREIATIEQAVSLMGIQHVRNLTLAVSVVSTFKSNSVVGLDLKRFWDHSLAVALGSRALATVERDRGNKEIDPEEAFLAGLVHDVGRVVIASNYHEEQKLIEQLVNENRDSYLHAELSALGFRHTELGHELTKTWMLSPAIQSAVLYHHEPKSHGLFPAIVSAADTLAYGLGFYTYCDKVQASDPSIWAELDLSDQVIEQVAIRMLQQFEAVQEMVA